MNRTSVNERAVLQPFIELLAEAIAERVAERLSRAPRQPPQPPQEPNDNRILLSTLEVAERLGISERTVTRLGIPVVRFGRIVRYDVEDVQRFIEAHKTGPQEREPHT